MPDLNTTTASQPSTSPKKPAFLVYEDYGKTAELPTHVGGEYRLTKTDDGRIEISEWIPTSRSATSIIGFLPLYSKDSTLGSNGKPRSAYKKVMARDFDKKWQRREDGRLWWDNHELEAHRSFDSVFGPGKGPRR